MQASELLASNGGFAFSNRRSLISANEPAEPTQTGNNDNASEHTAPESLNGAIAVGAKSFERMMAVSHENGLSAAIKLSRIYDKMAIGAVHFSYVKQNGDLRQAFGTRNPELIARYTSVTEADERNSRSLGDNTHLVYYDLTLSDGSSGWRCFCIADLIGLMSNETYTYLPESRKYVDIETRTPLNMNVALP